MPNYEKLYLNLFNSITDIIKELEKIQKDAEEMYISQDKLKNEEWKFINCGIPKSKIFFVGWTLISFSRFYINL